MEYSSEPLTAHYLNKGHKYRTLRTTVIAPKISAGLSIVGSAYIVQDVLRNPNKRTKSIYHRLMVGLSIADILVSFFFWFLTSWPMPKGYFILASGNLATCDATGFFNTIGMYGAPLYNCSLATYYLLQIKYNWPDRRMKAFEKYLHLVPWLVSISAAIIGLGVNAYGPLLSYCWVREYAFPVGCDLDGSSVECIRPYNGADLYFRFGFCILYILALVYVSTLMFMVYKKVLKVERDAEKFSFTRYTLNKQRKDRSKRKKSRRVMIQGILYSVALLIIVFMPIVVTIARVSGNEDPMIEVVMGFVNPLQGFLNMLIYLMPVFRKIHKKRRKKKNNNKKKNKSNTAANDNESKKKNKNVVEGEKNEDDAVSSMCWSNCWCSFYFGSPSSVSSPNSPTSTTRNKLCSTPAGAHSDKKSVDGRNKEKDDDDDDVININSDQGSSIFHSSRFDHGEVLVVEEEEKQEITRYSPTIVRHTTSLRASTSRFEAVDEVRDDDIEWGGLVIMDEDDEDEDDYF